MICAPVRVLGMTSSVPRRIAISQIDSPSDTISSSNRRPAGHSYRRDGRFTRPGGPRSGAKSAEFRPELPGLPAVVQSLNARAAEVAHMTTTLDDSPPCCGAAARWPPARPPDDRGPAAGPAIRRPRAAGASPEATPAAAGGTAPAAATRRARARRRAAAAPAAPLTEQRRPTAPVRARRPRPPQPIVHEVTVAVGHGAAARTADDAQSSETAHRRDRGARRG